MKAQAHRAELEFQPVTLTLQIESQDELIAFQQMFGADYSIPEHLKECEDINEDQRIVLCLAMSKVYNALCVF